MHTSARHKPSQRLNTLSNPPKILPLLPRNLPHRIRTTLLVLIAPLNLKRIEIDLHILLVDILRRVRGEATELRDEAEQLLHVVGGDVAGFVRGLGRGGVRGGAD